MILLTKETIESLREGDILIDQYYNGITFQYKLKEIHHDDTYVFIRHNNGSTFKATREQILNDLPPEEGKSFIIKKKRDDESILESL